MSNNLDKNTLTYIQKAFFGFYNRSRGVLTDFAIIAEFNDWLSKTIKSIKTPNEYESFLLQTSECPICKKRMLKKDESELFPTFIGYSQKKQLADKNMVIESEVYQGTDFICIECAEKGLATFKCDLCGEDKTVDKIKESFGDPDVTCCLNYLCKDCYGKVSAKEWDTISAKLEEEHKYDHL